jgi:hypothetical protein
MRLPSGFFSRRCPSSASRSPSSPTSSTCSSVVQVAAAGAVRRAVAS